MRSLRLLVCGVLLLLPVSSWAQVSRQGLLSTDALQAHGLERMWFTQLDVNRAQGRVVGMNYFVSPTRAHTVFEFEHEGKWYTFSERDRDAFGDVIGVEQAKLKADQALAKIVANLTAAGKPPTEAPKLESRVIPETTIAITTDRGTLQVLDGETGKTRWAQLVGSSRHPTTEPAISDGLIAVCNGSILYVYKAEDGQLAWQRQVGGAPGAGPAITDALVYVPMINGSMEIYRVDEPRRPVGAYRSFGRTMVQPVASNNSVAWPSDKGNLYVGFARGGSLRYRVEAKDSIDSPATFLPPDKVLATSLDGYVYCIGEGRGQILWRFTTGEPISQSALAIGDSVYAVTDSGELYCIAAADGSEQWLTSGIRSFVAGNENRLYCTERTGNLVILDAKSGSRLGTIAATGLDLRFLNTQTDRIIVGTSRGLLQCIRERGLVWPVAHGQLEPLTPAAPPSTQPATDPGAAPPAAADPFGAPAAEADPFAAPAAPPMPAADPFGADAAPAPAPPPAPAPEADPFASP